MLRGTILFIAMLLSSVTYGQVVDLQNIKVDAQEQLDNADKFGLLEKSPESELQDAIVFLATIEDEFPDTVPYIRFFTTYAVPENLREQTILTTSFVCHSLTGLAQTTDAGNYGAYYPLAMMTGRTIDKDGNITEEGEFTPLQQVPESDTLWWIDIRNYSWTPEAWEIVSKHDGYFASPVVRYDTNELLRRLAGNAIVRADWFNYYVTDTSLQLDIDSDTIPLYDTLLYAQKKRPTTLDEWRRAWGIDLEKSLALSNFSGTVVTKSKQVAKHNRMLFGYRTEIGYMYETYDVKHQRGMRDYIDSFFLNKNLGGFPDVSDAGEMFATNHLGMQVYGLRDGKGDIIWDGDTQVVRHINDVLGDVRVKTAISCIDCHTYGPLPAENVLREFIAQGIKTKTYDPIDKAKIESTFLSGRFEDNIRNHQAYFAKGLAKVNGLTPEENGDNYLKTISWYNRPIDLTQASIECGVSQAKFIDSVSKGQFGGRLKKLITDGETIPRDVWEHPGQDGIPGAFQQAMLLIRGFTKVTTQDEIIVETEQDVLVEKEIWYETTAQTTLTNYKGTPQTKITVQSGQTFKYAGETSGNFVLVEREDEKMWLNTKSAVRILK